jgi:hypothetical protein
MSEIYLLLQVLISGIVCGLILFQSIFVAPVVFRDLPEESRPIILRSLFPKLFKSMAFAGLIFIAISLIRAPESMIPYTVGTLTLIAGYVCHSMVRVTNQARDEGNDKLFSTLHRISVVLTLTALAANLVWIFLI